MRKKYDHHTYKPLEGEHKSWDDTSLSANRRHADQATSPFTVNNREMYDNLGPDQVAWLGRFHYSRTNTPQRMQHQSRFKKYMPIILKGLALLGLTGAGIGGYYYNRYKNSKRREQGNQGRPYLPTPTPMPTPPPVNMSNVLAGN